MSGTAEVIQPKTEKVETVNPVGTVDETGSEGANAGQQEAVPPPTPVSESKTGAVKFSSVSNTNVSDSSSNLVDEPAKFSVVDSAEPKTQTKGWTARRYPADGPVLR
jgi:hypothetical protein